METVLAFFSDLILFTAGLVVIIFWLGLLGVIAIETWDFFFEKEKNDDDLEEEY